MGRLYETVRQRVMGANRLRAVVRRGVRFVPDVTVVRDVPHVPQLAFGLRRHHWLMSRQCWAGHRRVLGLFEHLVRPDDVLFDIGANIGYYARLCLARLPLSQLIAFEPMGANLRVLRRNQAILMARGDNRLRIVPVALGDVDEQVELQIDDMSDGSAVLTKVSGGEAASGRAAKGLGPKAQLVNLTRLDRLMFESDVAPPLPAPNVMKLDTEGAEELVLRGAVRLLAEHRPRLILAMHGPDRARGVIGFLAGHGYKVAGWQETRGVPRWGIVVPEKAASLADNNCIASADEGDLGEPGEMEL